MAPKKNFPMSPNESLCIHVESLPG